MGLSEDAIRRRNKEENLRACHAIGRYDATVGNPPKRLPDFQGREDQFDSYMDGYQASAMAGPQGPYDRPNRSRSRSLSSYFWVFGIFSLIMSVAYWVLISSNEPTAIIASVASWGSAAVCAIVWVGQKIIRYMEDLFQ